MLRYNILNLDNSNNKKPLIVQNISLNETVINLPHEDYTAKIAAKLFKVYIQSPAEIKLIGNCDGKFYKLHIKSNEYELITILTDLTIEVFAPDGLTIIKLIAPPKEDKES